MTSGHTYIAYYRTCLVSFFKYFIKPEGTHNCASLLLFKILSLSQPRYYYHILFRVFLNSFGRTIVNTREILNPKWISPLSHLPVV